MSDRSDEQPILNSPYAYPGQHWELVKGLPTNQVVANRRRAELLSPFRKRRSGSSTGIFV